MRTGVAVTAIDRAAREVHTDDGDRHGYDHLVLATGSRAVVPPLPGLDPALPERVVAVPHPRRLPADPRRAPTAPARALVLGGGLLGLEAARGLAARGLDVTVVHAAGAPDGTAARPGRRGGARRHPRRARRRGPSWRSPATGVAADADGVRLDLADGRTLAADLLVLSCGVRPDTALAARGRADRASAGVVVDDRLRTSDRRISAIGDCAQHDGVARPGWSPRPGRRPGWWPTC